MTRLKWGGLMVAVLVSLTAACGPPPDPYQTESSRRMAERLADLDETGFLKSYQGWLPDRRPKDPVERLTHDWWQAYYLLARGETEEAIAELEALVGRLGEEDYPAEKRRSVRSLLAIAYLRLAEQVNCIDHHNIDSCLLPIRGHGVHRQQEAARSALAQYHTLLAQDPEDLGARWLLNIAAMAVGEYPQEVAERWLIPPQAFESDAAMERFYDIASELGVDTVAHAGGSVMEDFDRDGRMDLMASSYLLRDPLRVFLQQPGGSFLERTAEAGLRGLGGSLNLIHADYDNDGLPDVLVLRGAWFGKRGRHPNSLLRNRGAGAAGSVSFQDVTEEAGLLDAWPTQVAAWGDFDNDGWLDLFIGNESRRQQVHPCQLFHNNGDGTFTDVAPELGLDITAYVKGAAWGDIDNDGLIDLYISSLFEPNLLFRNQGPDAAGRWRFRDVTEEAGVAEPVRSFPVWFFDYDNDGWLDLFVGSFDTDIFNGDVGAMAADYLGQPTEVEKARLYHNRGVGADGRVTFEDLTHEAGLDRVLWVMGANFGDVDNDGYQDIYLGTGAPDYRALMPNRMFRNNGAGAFEDVTTAGGFGHLQKGHGISFGDLDNDGDQDVFAVMGGSYGGDVYQDALFENPGNDHHWITLELEGVRANRSALGARIKLVVDGPEAPREIHALVSTGGSFGSSTLQQEIGLGNAVLIRRLEVRWPGSGEQVFTDVAADRFLRLREGGELIPVEREISSRNPDHTSSAHGNHHSE